MKDLDYNIDDKVILTNFRIIKEILERIETKLKELEQRIENLESGS